MAETRKRRKRKGRQRNSAKANAPKRLARQRLSRSKRRRFTHRVAPPKAGVRVSPKANVTAKPPGPLPERTAAKESVKAEKPVDDVLTAAKAAVAAKAVHKTAPTRTDKTDGVKKATAKPANVRDARPHEKPQQSDRPSGSQYQKAPPKGKGPQGKK
jgi:hypothetical protein